MITMQEAYLFVDDSKLDAEVKIALEQNGVTVLPYTEVIPTIQHYAGYVDTLIIIIIIIIIIKIVMILNTLTQPLLHASRSFDSYTPHPDHHTPISFDSDSNRIWMDSKTVNCALFNSVDPGQVLDKVRSISCYYDA